MRFEGKNAIVTGGSTGIGKAVTLGLAREGANIAIVSNLSLEEMAPVADEVRSLGVTAECYQCDISDHAAVEAVTASVEAKFGKIDMVHHCAGMFALNPVFDSPGDQIDALIDVNVKGTYYVVHSALSRMRASGGGAIVVVASNSGILGQPPFSGYSASKAAVIRLVATIGPELKGTGIRINCIAPGATRTPMTAHVHSPQQQDRAASLENLNRIIPSAYGEPWLEPEDQANVMLFLASDASRGIQGQCVIVDQGLSAALPYL